MTILLIGVATMVSTFLGGIVAFLFKDRLHLILGFSAGAVLGVAFFDLLPEALSLGSSYFSLMASAGYIAFGFLSYLFLDRLLLGTEEQTHHHRGNLGVTGLITHSFFDGVAIGLSFQVSSAIGIVVATAVLVHDFSDGINTVNLSFLGGSSNKSARVWLGIGSIAPLIGIISTFFFVFSESQLAIALHVFAGIFLYLGATELLPESYHRHPKLWTTLSTLLGVATMYGAIHFVN